MKKFVCLWMILALLFTCLPVSADTVTEPADEVEEPDPSVLEGCRSIDAHRGILGEASRITNCTAAFLFEYNTDTLMYSYNGDSRISPASLVKIMTALIAIDRGDLKSKVTVDRSSFSTLPHDAAMIRDPELKDGEIFTLEDMLNLMLLDSANEAAIVIAEHIYGTQAVFVEEMNKLAEELGCKDTNFTNVHGMYDENQYSTCRDIARILDKAMEYEAFRKVFGAVYYTIPATNMNESIRSLTTDNFHLTQDEAETYYDRRVTGGRTGVGLNKDRCIASTASQGGLDMICIIFGANSVYDENNYKAKIIGGYKEVSALLDDGFDGFKSVQILHDGQILKQIDIDGGECDLTIGPKESISTIIPQDIYLDDLNFVYSDAATSHSAPISKDQYISTVRISYGNLCLAEVELYAMNSVRTVQDSYKIIESKQEGKTFWTWTLIIAIGLVLIIAVLLIWPRVRRRISSRSNRMKNYYTGRRGRR